MDETKRQQTTKGMLHLFYTEWQCKTSIRHLDVSRQGYERHGHGRRRNRRTGTRGGPGKTRTLLLSPSLTCCAQDFERKSALFSLASSEILIVNLWEHQVGLYQGANMGLLKTVFEVNLGLFGKKSIDEYVPNPYFFIQARFERDLRVEQADGHYYSSSFETILDKPLLRIWKPH